MKNQLSIAIMVLFLFAELFYLKIIPVNYINQNAQISTEDVIEINETESLLSNDEISDSTTSESTICKISDEKSFPSGTPRFATVSEAYFENTLFVGDSRMVGFSIYRRLEGATYYCYQSAGAFSILDKEYEVAPYGMISLYNLLTINRFDKIYISLGINNLAAELKDHRDHYKKMIDTIAELQPNAIIYLLANLHITSIYANNSQYLTNENINYTNMFISKLADNKRIFYLDPNILYDDEFGNMDSQLSFDCAHIYIKHYDRYLYFLLTHAVVYDE